MMWSAWRWVTNIARTSGRSGAEPLVDGEPGPPQLPVDALAAVDEVDGVADDDRVGVAASVAFGIGPAAGAEEDQSRRASARRGARRSPPDAMGQRT